MVTLYFLLLALCVFVIKFWKWIIEQKPSGLFLYIEHVKIRIFRTINHRNIQGINEKPHHQSNIQPVIWYYFNIALCLFTSDTVLASFWKKCILRNISFMERSINCYNNIFFVLVFTTGRVRTNCKKVSTNTCFRCLICIKLFLISVKISDVRFAKFRENFCQRQIKSSPNKNKN